MIISISSIKKQKRQQEKRFADMIPMWASLRENGAALTSRLTCQITLRFPMSGGGWLV